MLTKGIYKSSGSEVQSLKKVETNLLKISEKQLAVGLNVLRERREVFLLKELVRSILKYKKTNTNKPKTIRNIFQVKCHMKIYYQHL